MSKTIELTIRIDLRRLTAEEIDDEETVEMLAEGGDEITEDELEDYANHVADALTAIDQRELMAGSDCFLTGERSSLVGWKVSQ